VRPSERGGMGAALHPDGTTFRVWAPFAEAVSVAGDFNDWSADSTSLASEANGYWSTHVPDVRRGAKYRFVIRSGTATVWRNDPYARAVTHSAGSSVVCDPFFDWGDSHYRIPPWNEMVIYELHAGTFNDAPGGGPGSFESVARRMAYLENLGINAIELMPSMEFATDFSWGYNPSHIFAIEEAYGGPDGLKQLVRAAHEVGIAMIFDVVYNHFGPSDLDLWRFDGWGDKGGIYFYNDRRCQTPWGDTRPDYGREEVRRFIADNARMWLDEFRFDGLRWDATAYIRNIYGNDADPADDVPDGWRLMQQVNQETNDHQPWKLNIAEDLRGNHWITQDTWTDGAGFDAQWDAEFVHPVRAAMVAPSDGGRNMNALAKAITYRYNDDAFRRVIYTESHDEVANGKARLAEEIFPGNSGSWFSRKRSTLAAALVFTSPGIPMIFQGQEILEDAWFHDQDPVDWTKERTYGGILRLYRDLIRLRRNWHDSTRGLTGQHVNVYHVNDADNVIAFHRSDRGGPRDDVVVVINVANSSYGNYRIGFPRRGDWRVRFNSDWSGYGQDFGNHSSYDTVAEDPPSDSMPQSGRIGIGPYSAVVYSQDA
jgi:1,4-alpha-glucan branching enzyme